MNESLERAERDSRPDLVEIWSALLDEMKREMPPKPMSVNSNDEWKSKKTSLTDLAYLLVNLWA